MRMSEDKLQVRADELNGKVLRLEEMREHRLAEQKRLHLLTARQTAVRNFVEPNLMVPIIISIEGWENVWLRGDGLGEMDYEKANACDWTFTHVENSSVEAFEYMAAELEKWIGEGPTEDEFWIDEIMDTRENIDREVRSVCEALDRASAELAQFYASHNRLSEKTMRRRYS
jgi:hypothetical protein